MWFYCVIRDSEAGFHTSKVQRGLLIGFFMFIFSEVMFFFSIFWGFFYFTLGKEYLCVFADAGKNPPVFTEPLISENFFRNTSIGRLESKGLYSWEYILEAYKKWAQRANYVLPKEYYRQSIDAWAQNESEHFRAFQNWFLMEELKEVLKGVALVSAVILLYYLVIGGGGPPPEGAAVVVLLPDEIPEAWAIDERAMQALL